MFIADVHLPERILRNSRRSENGLIKRGIVALRLGLDLWLADRILGGAKRGYDLSARLIEPANDSDWIQFGDCTARLRRRRGIGWNVCRRFLT